MSLLIPNRGLEGRPGASTLTVHSPTSDARLAKRGANFSSISALYRYTSSVHDEYTEETANKDTNSIMKDFDNRKVSFIYNALQDD